MRFRAFLIWTVFKLKECAPSLFTLVLCTCTTLASLLGSCPQLVSCNFLNTLFRFRAHTAETRTVQTPRVHITPFEWSHKSSTMIVESAKDRASAEHSSTFFSGLVTGKDVAIFFLYCLFIKCYIFNHKLTHLSDERVWNWWSEAQSFFFLHRSLTWWFWWHCFNTNISYATLFPTAIVRSLVTAFDNLELKHYQWWAQRVLFFLHHSHSDSLKSWILPQVSLREPAFFFPKTMFALNRNKNFTAPLPQADSWVATQRCCSWIGLLAFSHAHFLNAHCLVILM